MEKVKAEDCSDEYQNVYGQHYAYSISLPAMKVANKGFYMA